MSSLESELEGENTLCDIWKLFTDRFLHKVLSTWFVGAIFGSIFYIFQWSVIQMRVGNRFIGSRINFTTWKDLNTGSLSWKEE